MRLKIPGFAALLFALSLLLACDDSLDPIFYTLEKEEPVKDTGLDNEISVLQMTKTATDYYIAAGQVYTRPVASSDWNRVQIPYGDMCNSIAYYTGSSHLYAGFFESLSGDAEGLWYTDPASINWQRVSGIPADAQITRLKVANNRLFAIALIGDDYKLYRSSGGDTFTPVTTPSLGFYIPITDITWDATYSRYWIAAGTSLYYDDSDPPTNFTKLTSSPGTDCFGGVFYSSISGTPTLYVSTKDGQVHLSTNNGVTWSSSDEVEVSGETVRFGDFAEAGGDILVASEGYGYYRLDGGLLDDDDFEDSRSPNYNSDLYDAAIECWLVNGSSVFAGTMGEGLWRSDDITDDDWSLE